MIYFYVMDSYTYQFIRNYMSREVAYMWTAPWFNNVHFSFEVEETNLVFFFAPKRTWYQLSFLESSQNIHVQKNAVWH